MFKFRGTNFRSQAIIFISFRVPVKTIPEQR